MSFNIDTSDWKRVRFGDVADRSREQASQSDGSIKRYIAGGHFDHHALEVTRWGDPGDGGMGSTFTYVSHPGQVLYVSASWYLRKVGVATFDAVVADKTYVIETRDSEVLDQRFLPWVLLSDALHDYAKSQATGSMNARLLWSTLGNFEFDLPPIDEQQRIADLLWVLERHRATVRGLRTSMANVQARWRESVFNGTAERARLDDRAEVMLGRQRAPQHASGEHMRDYVRSASITNGRVSLDGLKQMNFTPTEQTKFRLVPGDVLVSEGTASSRELGSSARWDPEDPNHEMYFQKTLLRLRARPGRSTPILLREWAQWAQESGAFVGVASGTGILHITGVRCAAMPFPMFADSDLRETESLAIELSRAASASENESAKLIHLQAAILNDLFGGN